MTVLPTIIVTAIFFWLHSLPIYTFVIFDIRTSNYKSHSRVEEVCSINEYREVKRNSGSRDVRFNSRRNGVRSFEDQIGVRAESFFRRWSTSIAEARWTTAPQGSPTVHVLSPLC